MSRYTENQSSELISNTSDLDPCNVGITNYNGENVTDLTLPITKKDLKL